MAYVDTNVLISYYFDEEELHEVSTRILNMLKTMQKKIYISPLTLVELYSVIAIRKCPSINNTDMSNNIKRRIKSLEAQIKLLTKRLSHSRKYK